MIRVVRVATMMRVATVMRVVSLIPVQRNSEDEDFLKSFKQRELNETLLDVVQKLPLSNMFSAKIAIVL